MASDNKVCIQTVPITLEEAFKIIDIQTDGVLIDWQNEFEKEAGTFAAQQRIKKCRTIVDDCVKAAVILLLKVIYGKIAYEHLGELRQIEKQEDALFSKN